MKSTLLALSLLFAATHVFAQTNGTNGQTEKSAEQAKKDECSISGMVVKLTTSEPLKSASIRLISAENKDRTIKTVSDMSGHFRLKGIQPGRYTLQVSHLGFVTSAYGQKKPDDPGAILTLTAGTEKTDMLFRLTPAAVISGRITNEDGDPVPWAQVTALREVYSEGKRRMNQEANQQTNDLGEYRLFDLKPGRYFVSVVNNRENWFGPTEDFQPPPDDPTRRGYVTLYYPNTTDPTKATSLAVKGGEEVSSIDVRMQPVSVYKVNGRVLNLAPSRKPERNAEEGSVAAIDLSVASVAVPDGAAMTIAGGGTGTVMLSPRGARGWSFDGHVGTIKKDNSFVIQDVPPGSYTLMAMASADGKSLVTRQAVEVQNGDVDGVVITLAPGTTINGRVEWDGKPSLEQDQLYVTASPADEAMFFTAPGKVSADGTFVLRDVQEDNYQLKVFGISNDCYIKEARYGSSDALENGFNVQRNSDARLEVTLSSRGARVTGKVTDADGLPVGGLWVVLVPSDRKRGQFDLYKTATTDQYGHFELRGIAPGDYKIFSWDEVEERAWEDPEFLTAFERKGQAVSLQEGDQKAQDIVVIQTKEGPKEKQRQN
jgi:protocatechuate 3,4-dioxygenase beta subunit